MQRGTPIGRLGARASRILLQAGVLLGVATAGLASEPEDAEAHGYHRHHVEVFLGAAVRDEEEHGTASGFAGGVDYNYRIARLLGVGLVVEAATGGLRDVVVMGALALHPWRGLRLVAAPGVEISRGGVTEFAMRLGVGYQFPVGRRFTISPGFNADLIDGTPTYVVGLNFGVGF